MFFIWTSPVLVFHSMLTLAYSLHTCILIIALASLHLHTLTLADFCTWMLLLFHLHWGTYSVHVCSCLHVVVQVWKCQCVSVSVEVSVFKGFSGRTLRNAFEKNVIKNVKRYARLPDRMSEDMPERMSGDMPERMSKYCFNTCPNFVRLKCHGGDH